MTNRVPFGGAGGRSTEGDVGCGCAILIFWGLVFVFLVAYGTFAFVGDPVDDLFAGWRHQFICSEAACPTSTPEP